MKQFLFLLTLLFPYSFQISVPRQGQKKSKPKPQKHQIKNTSFKHPGKPPLCSDPFESTHTSKELNDFTYGSMSLPIDIPERNQDPRLSNRCRKVFGSIDGNLSVFTIEDIIAKTNKQESPRGHICSLLNPYGKFVSSVQEPGDSFNKTYEIFYVEIPKVASSTFKEWLPICIHPKFGDGVISKRYSNNPPNFNSIKNPLSFVIVREPLQRFLSGYQTIRIRSLLKSSPLLTRSKNDELIRFKEFVSLFTSKGAILKNDLKYNAKNTCVWCHTLSQLWFIEMYPLPITYVLHLESLSKELNILSLNLPIILPKINKSPFPILNTKEQRKSIGVLSPNDFISNLPHSIKSILHYLRQDYICLDYPIPKI